MDYISTLDTDINEEEHLDAEDLHDDDFDNWRDNQE